MHAQVLQCTFPSDTASSRRALEFGLMRKKGPELETLSILKWMPDECTDSVCCRYGRLSVYCSLRACLESVMRGYMIETKRAFHVETFKFLFMKKKRKQQESGFQHGSSSASLHFYSTWIFKRCTTHIDRLTVIASAAETQCIITKLLIIGMKRYKWGGCPWCLIGRM